MTMANTDISTLVTVVKCQIGNTAASGGSPTFFGFLPPHGKALYKNQQAAFLGDIVAAVNRGDRFGLRSMQGLTNALNRGDLIIQSTPAPILYDTTLGSTKALYLNSGTLHLLPTSWTHSVTLGEHPEPDMPIPIEAAVAPFVEPGTTRPEY